MIRVVNAHKHKPTANDIYIGRGSPLGNPFKIGTHGTRQDVIRQYEDHLGERIAQGDMGVLLMLEIIERAEREGKDTNLVCYCAPQACHGDFIKAFIEYSLTDSDPSIP